MTCGRCRRWLAEAKPEQREWRRLVHALRPIGERRLVKSRLLAGAVELLGAAESHGPWAPGT
jgi:hypothetical protein